MTKFRPDRIENMMRQYSKFGLNESQLKQLRGILESGKVSVAQTNALITDAASSELQMGHSYVGKGSSPGMLQSRNNLLRLINENSQSTPKVTPTSTSPSPSSSSRSSALARTNRRGNLVRQSAPTSTSSGTPSSKGGGLTRTPGYQGGARARPGGPNVNIRGGGVPTPGNPGGYGTPRVTPKPNNVQAPVKSAVSGLRTGIAGAIIGGAADYLNPLIAREAVRGAMVVTGQDTTNYDNANAGRPVVKNVGGVSYNINDPDQRAAYKKAVEGNRPQQTQTNRRGRPINTQTSSTATLAPASVMPDIRGTSGDNYKQVELALAAAARPPAQDPAPPAPPTEPPTRPDETTRTSGGVSQSGRQLGGMMSLGDATTLAGGYLADLGNYFPATAADPSARTSGNVTGVVINGKRYENLSGDDLSEAQEAWRTSNPSDRETNFIYDSADQAQTVPIPGGPTNWMQPQGALARNANRAFLDAPRGGGAMGALRARDAQLGVVEGASGKKYAQINGQMVELGDGQYQSIIGRDADAIRGIIDAYPEGSVMPGGNVAPENVAISPAQTQQPAFGIAPAMPSPAANYQRLASGVQRAVQYGLTPEGSPNTAYSAEIFNRSMQMPAENFYDMLALPAEKEIPQEVFDSFDYRDLY